MVVPPDWAKPSPDNHELCKAFSYGKYTKGALLPYRLYCAPQDKPLPLVLYLHGADAVGEDNEQQLSMHDIGTMFARPSWQTDHPCHIVAPQYHRGQHWSAEGVAEAVQELVEELAEQLKADKQRIYVYGYSAGAVGTFRMIKNKPEYYAGAIAICGATEKEHLERLIQTPVWMVHAADDPIVKATYRDGREKELYHYGSKDIYEELGQTAERMKYTEFEPGKIKQAYGVHPHCSWVAVSDPKNVIFREWLFMQKR